MLFHELRIRRRCSIITDLDAAFINPIAAPNDDAETLKLKGKLLRAQESGAARKVVLDGLAATNKWLKPFYATNTFEIDFVACGNAEKAVLAVNDVYTQLATRMQSTTELRSNNVEEYGKRILAMAAYNGKGWFAILLGKHLDTRTVIPPYIRNAIIFAHGKFSTELMYNILHHRVAQNNVGTQPSATLLAYWNRLLEFRAGRVDFNTLRAETLIAFPNDQICAFLGDIP